MSQDATIVEQRQLAKAWGRLDEYTIRQRRADGSVQTLKREVYDHGHAAAVLLHDAKTDHVVLTRQFRLPAELCGDPARLIEAPAGLLDGEAPDVAVRREVLEETGFAAEALELVANVYMSPGSLTEKCALFLGRYDPAARVGLGGGLAHEGEDIEVIELPFAQAMAMIGTGEIIDAKTVLLLQALALRLR